MRTKSWTASKWVMYSYTDKLATNGDVDKVWLLQARNRIMLPLDMLLWR